MRARLLAIALATIGVLTLFASTGASAQGAPLFAVLLGGQECNGAAPPLCRQGDLDAFGSATITFPTATQVCYGITVHRLVAITGAHIHPGQAGVNGGIVVNMTPAGMPVGNPFAWGGCVAATSATVSQIKANPSNFYVNVHSSAFINGAIRGQLF